MPRLLRVLLVLLSIIIGATFLYSAYTKLFPIHSFELTMIEYIRLPAKLAAILARFFTGLEASLGALIVLHLYGHWKWVLKTALALLIGFSGYLIWLWAIAGNDVNCGCFGDAIWMSPSTSLIKNAVMIVLIWLLIKYHKGITYKWTSVVPLSVLISAIASIFIFFPVFSRYKIDLKPMYTADSTAGTTFIPNIDLSKGKHIIAFVSPSCIHCRRAGLLMHDILHHNPSLPIYMVIGGTTSDLKDFWAASKAEDVPHTRLATEPFMKLSKGIFPTILWVNNGMVEGELLSYKDLDEKVLEKWMKAKD